MKDCCSFLLGMNSIEFLIFVKLKVFVVVVKVIVNFLNVLLVIVKEVKVCGLKIKFWWILLLIIVIWCFWYKWLIVSNFFFV